MVLLWEVCVALFLPFSPACLFFFSISSPCRFIFSFISFLFFSDIRPLGPSRSPFLSAFRCYVLTSSQFFPQSLPGSAFYLIACSFGRLLFLSSHFRRFLCVLVYPPCRASFVVLKKFVSVLCLSLFASPSFGKPRARRLMGQVSLRLRIVPPSQLPRSLQRFIIFLCVPFLSVFRFCFQRFAFLGPKNLFAFAPYFAFFFLLFRLAKVSFCRFSVAPSC